MDRNEILSKVENGKNYDEREEKILFNALSISTLITQFLCIILIFYRMYLSVIDGTKDNISDLIALIFVQYAFTKIYEFKMLKRKTDLVLFIIYVIITIISLIFYFDTGGAIDFYL